MKKISLESARSTLAGDMQVICLEAGVLSNMVSTIKNVFPDFIQKLTTSFAQIESIPEVKTTLPELQQFVVKHLNDKQYLDLADLTISVPEGFSGSFLGYVSVLDEIALTHLTITQTVLNPFTAYLSHFISNKDAKISTGDTTGKYVLSKNTRQKDILAIAHYKNHDFQSTAKLGQVISRKPDLLAVYDKTAHLTGTLAKTNLKSVQEQVKHCVELLNIIVDQVQQNKILSITPEVTKNLAFSALQIAEEIEFMALVHFKSLGFVTSIDSMTNTLHKFITQTQ